MVRIDQLLWILAIHNTETEGEKMEKRNLEHGFTFVEVLIGLFIAVLVATALVSFTRLSFDSHLTVTNTMEEIWESRQTMNLISEEVKYAIDATPAPDNSSLTYLYPDPTDPQATISNRLFIGADRLLYVGNNLFPRPITKKSVNGLICKYNTDDPQNHTIDITVTFCDMSTLSTTVITLNTPDDE